MSHHKSSRLRLKLVQLLGYHGIDVKPQDIWCQDGAHRHKDGARWGASGRWIALKDNQVATITIFSWDTMTACVRSGIEIDVKRTLEIEVHSND